MLHDGSAVLARVFADNEVACSVCAVKMSSETVALYKLALAEGKVGCAGGICSSASAFIHNICIVAQSSEPLEDFASTVIVAVANNDILVFLTCFANFRQPIAALGCTVSIDNNAPFIGCRFHTEGYS